MIILQYWIYETLETLHEWIDLIDLYVSPRMLRWRTRDVPVWTHIGRIFTSDPVCTSKLISRLIHYMLQLF